MNRVFIAGVAATLAGVGGYAIGIATPFPGRSLSVTAVMVGVSMIFVHGAWEGGAGP